MTATIHTFATDRQQVRAALDTLAAAAKAQYPDSAGRIDKAVALVLAGDVALAPDGTALVGSASTPAQRYAVNGACVCADVARAPGGLCKHRFAKALQIRLGRLQPPAPGREAEAPPVPEAPLPEAAFSLTLKGTIDGHEALLTARGQTPVAFQANLAAIRGLLDPPKASRIAQEARSAADEGPGQGATPVCPHGHGALKRSTKGKGYYCPHKTDAGQWCPGK